MAGWHHHIAMCLLGGAFLLGLQQDWGGKMPRERFGPDELLLSIGVRKGPPTTGCSCPGLENKADGLSAGEIGICLVTTMPTGSPGV